MKDWAYLTTQHIATQCGVAHSTVRVWRHRFDDFHKPEQVVGGTGLYDPDKVAEWLTKHNRREE